MSDLEIAVYFSNCANKADTMYFIEPVEAICNVLNCSFEEALIILN